MKTFENSLLSLYVENVNNRGKLKPFIKYSSHNAFDWKSQYEEAVQLFTMNVKSHSFAFLMVWSPDKNWRFMA